MATKHAVKHTLPRLKNARHNGNGTTAASKRSVNKTAHPFAWIDELIAKVPPEAWDALPTDGSVNHDHYLYGAPKREFHGPTHSE